MKKVRQQAACEIDFLVRVTAKVTKLGLSYLKYNCLPGGKVASVQT